MTLMGEYTDLDKTAQTTRQNAERNTPQALQPKYRKGLYGSKAANHRFHTNR